MTLIKLAPTAVLFEGWDGAGKSTLARMLAEQTDGLYFPTPPGVLGKEIREYHDTETSAETRYMFYLLGNLHASDEIRRLRGRRTIVVDRYIHTTVATNRFAGVELCFDPYELGYERPDYSFFMYVSDEAERLSRIAERGKKTKFDELMENTAYRTAYTEYFKQTGEFHFIDTASKSPEESLQEIIEILQIQGGGVHG